MPEVVSKYPEVTLQVLKEAGINCGEGLPQKILTACSSEQFCAFPTGEMCVYGVNDVPQMTQISSGELAQFVPTPTASLWSQEVLFTLVIVFVVALVLGYWFGRKGRHRRRS